MSGDLDQFDPRFFEDYEEERTSEFLGNCQYDWANLINDELLNEAFQETGTNLPGMLLYLANHVISSYIPHCLPYSLVSNSYYHHCRKNYANYVIYYISLTNASFNKSPIIIRIIFNFDVYNFRGFSWQLREGSDDESSKEEQDGKCRQKRQARTCLQ